VEGSLKTTLFEYLLLSFSVKKIWNIASATGQ